MTTTETNSQITAEELIKTTPLLQELLRQIRAHDPYGTFRNWSDELILKPFVVSKEQKRKISVDGEVDPITKSRISTFYRAIASIIEQETGLLSQVVIDLSHEGFGWVLVFSGRLLLVSKTLRDAQRFGFDSLEKLVAEGDKIAKSAIELARKHGDVAQL